VNRDGKAFRDARILPAYLDARLAELKWGVVVQEMARQRQEEQRALREEMRDRELAKREQEAKEREAAKLEEMKRQAVEEAEKQFAQASAEEKERLQRQLEEARQQLAAATEQKLQISQLTKVGRIYIISNIGSFGDGVYKIGETQRDHEVRVKELGGASVPFEFDIHAVIETENSRALEHRLHHRFADRRVNKMNMRKEFFRVSLTEIQREIEKLKEGEDYTRKQWTEEARAKQWKETCDIESDPQKLHNWLRNSAGRQVGSDDSMS
jgi:multidrug efflux pump subunit AcrA (membrane-fusion protein)